MIDKDCIIIGGGVAGLSAAIRLTELGKAPLVLEAGQYPGQRICGEFFSPECLPILQKWNVTPAASIEKCSFISHDKCIHFTLPATARGTSRYDFDMQLVQLARKNGAEVLTEAVVDTLLQPKSGKDPYQVVLADGRSFQSKSLMIGTGRLPQLKHSTTSQLTYAGFKAHFSDIDMHETLEMHCFDGGYVGISPVADGIVNIACLVRLDRMQGQDNFMQTLATQQNMQRFSQHLEKGRMLFPAWMMGKVPEFGMRQNPAWPNVFWIGDAAGSIPPVCGDGLGIAITTGVMAAEYFSDKGAEAFKKDWLQSYRRRFFWGRLLHEVVQRPYLSSFAAGCCRLFPSLPHKLFKLTRS